MNPLPCLKKYKRKSHALFYQYKRLVWKFDQYPQKSNFFIYGPIFTIFELNTDNTSQWLNLKKEFDICSGFKIMVSRKIPGVEKIKGPPLTDGRLGRGQR